MEKYSKWRDPATGIQPFLPISTTSHAPIFVAILTPFSLFHSLVRVILLAAVVLIHVLLVDGVLLVFSPIAPLYDALRGAFTALTARLALAFMGYWWIVAETASSKRASSGVSQIANRSPARGDLIVSNWTSYVDVLYLAFRFNPTFVLPVFESAPEIASSGISTATSKTGRHTGTGSAQIANAPLPQPAMMGYQAVPLLGMLARTGSLPPTSTSGGGRVFRTLREARAASRRPVALLPEGTTSNGRALLRFAEGVLADEDFITQTGRVFLMHFKHSQAHTSTSSATCPLPSPMKHLVFHLLWTPTPAQRRDLTVRTLHPAASPSSPSFLPTEILKDTPGGLEGVGRDGKGAWREAIATVLAETGRIRRVRGMGWVEKAAFLEYRDNATRRR